MEEGHPSQKTDRREEDDDKNGKRPGFPAAGMKLRIGGPKLSPPSVAEEKKVHVCRSCNKIFSSGKALGGHMSSAHVQANRDYAYKKKQQLRLRGAAASDEEEEEWDEELASRQYFRGKDGKIVCILCDKKFPSRKSLFGHMRCHPERCWRGMEPPHPPPPPPQQPPLIQYNHHRHPNINLENHHQATTSTSSGSPASVDLQTLLWSWSVKGQRGRAPIPAAFSSSSSDEVKPVNLPVNADSPYLHSSLKNPNLEIPSKKIDNGRFNFQSKGKGKAIWEPRFRSQEKSSSSEFNFDQIHDEDDDVSKNFSSEDDEEALGLALVSLKNLGSPFPAKNCSNNSNNSNKKRRICENGLMDFEIGSGEDSNKFKCSTCSKSFTTHQALGGHRSSHNKFKVTIQNAIDDPRSLVPGVNNDDNDDENGENVEVGVLANYQCGVCKKNFPSRRALGGHKKCHSAAHEYSLGQQQEIVVAAVASSSPERSSTTPVVVVEDRPKVLAFDLNEVPDIMDE